MVVVAAVAVVVVVVVAAVAVGAVAVVVHSSSRPSSSSSSSTSSSSSCNDNNNNNNSNIAIYFLKRAHGAVQLKCNSSGSTRSQWSQLAEPLLTDPGLKSETSVGDLISTLKKKSVGGE